MKRTLMLFVALVAVLLASCGSPESADSSDSASSAGGEAADESNLLPPLGDKIPPKDEASPEQVAFVEGNLEVMLEGGVSEESANCALAGWFGHLDVQSLADAGHNAGNIEGLTVASSVDFLKEGSTEEKAKSDFLTCLNDEELVEFVSDSSTTEFQCLIDEVGRERFIELLSAFNDVDELPEEDQEIAKTCGL